jgi:phosphonate degradation associated HDIG domain protein
MTHAALFREILSLYDGQAQKRYGLADVNQREHALQCALAAEQAGEGPAMILAALLHDVGHMVHQLGENPAADGIDDKHEAIGAKWLKKRLPDSVWRPVALHVAAKRYLCGSEADYFARLAPDSVLSLKLQGGPMSAAEQTAFLAEPFAADAIRLRRYDETAKLAGAQTPDVAHYLALLDNLSALEAAKADLARDGFVVLRGFFSPAEQARLGAFSDRFGAAAAAILSSAARARQDLAVRARENPDELIVVPEAARPDQVCRFEYLLGSDPEFADFAGKRITSAMSALGGEALVPFKDKENEKHPGGGAFGPHQDFAAYQAFGPTFNLTAMISIDGATVANGCLAFATNHMSAAKEIPSAVATWVEGRPLFAFHAGGPQNGDIIDAAVRALDWRLVETGPGDLTVFDSFVPHQSAPNGTAASRRAMFLTYSRAREGAWYDRYYADKRANYADPKFHVSTPTAHA